MLYNELKQIRVSGPVHYMEDATWGVPYWLITGRDEIDYISKSPELFSSEARSALANQWSEEEMVAIQRNMTINMYSPRHLQNRRIVRSSFSSSKVQSHEGSFRAHARRIVDAVAGCGQCEFVTEVAAELPLLAILELCGIPPKDRKDVFEWTNTMMFSDDPDMSVSEEESQLASLKVIEYAIKLAAQHRDNPRDDIIGALLTGQEGDQGLTEDEFCWFFLMRRTALVDAEVAGHRIRAGDKIILHYHTVNHDEKIFGEDAMKFDVRRAQRMPEL